MIKKNDIKLIIFILIMAGAIYLAYGFIFGTTDEVCILIEINGEEYGTYDISKNQVINIESDYGTNLVVVEDEKVMITDADCPDKICVKHIKIENAGESIICLPHRLVVSIIRKK